MSPKKTTPSEGKRPARKAPAAVRTKGKSTSAAKSARPAAEKAKPAKAKKAAQARQPAPALPKEPKPARAAKGARPTAPKSGAPKGATGREAIDLTGLPTEDIWTHYRSAIAARPREEAWIERLRNVLMELHYPLVRHIAERLLQTLPKSIELEDLVSAGLFGLMDAIRGFDPGRGIKFKTYCTTRIRGSILDQLRSQDWVPRLVRLKAGRIEKALQKLQGEYGREPTHAELAETLRMEHGELALEIASSRAKTMFSLSERWDDRDDESSMEKVDVVEDKTAVDPIGELHKRDLMNYITRALSHKERFIIEQYYQVGHTMREIGEMLALTESRVCQIHSNVMARLKALLGPDSNSLSA